MQMLGKAGANRSGNHFASLDFSLNWPHRYMESRPSPGEKIHFNGGFSRRERFFLGVQENFAPV